MLCLRDPFELRIVGDRGPNSGGHVMNPRGIVIIQKSHFSFSFEFPSYGYLYSASAREKKKKS